MTGFDELAAALRRARAELDAAARPAAPGRRARGTGRDAGPLSPRRGATRRARSDSRRARAAHHASCAAGAASRPSGPGSRPPPSRESPTRFEPSPTREAIGRLDDAHPILLFPVRIETRFGTADDGSRSSGCASIPTTARSTPSTRAVRGRGRQRALYWIDIWRAGGVEDQRAGAWAALVARTASGRAAVAARPVGPLNPAEEPVRAAATDVLVIATDAAGARRREAAVAGTGRPRGRPAPATPRAPDARRPGRPRVGSARAAEIAVATLTPTNFHDAAGEPHRRR